MELWQLQLCQAAAFSLSLIFYFMNYPFSDSLDHQGDSNRGKTLPEIAFVFFLQSLLSLAGT